MVNSAVLRSGSVIVGAGLVGEAAAPDVAGGIANPSWVMKTGSMVTAFVGESGMSRPMTMPVRMIEFGSLAWSTISWNRSCETMVSRSTSGTPVRLP